MTTQNVSLDEIQIERLDDIPLLIGLQQQLGLDAIIDEVIPRHWRHEGLSLGQLVVGWNAYILQKPTTARLLLNSGVSSIKRCCQICLACQSVAPISVMTA